MSKLVDLHEIAKDLPKHVKISADYWYLGLYKRKDLGMSDRDFLRNLDKILVEQELDKLNNKHSTIQPIKSEIRNNVILNQGMEESIDRDINVSSTALDFASVGTSSTAEAATQTDLIAEDSGGGYARRQFSVTGTRTRLNQTMKLSESFNDTQVSAVPITLKEAGVHWTVATASTCHARVVFSDFILDTGDLFVFQINELQENGTV